MVTEKSGIVLFQGWISWEIKSKPYSQIGTSSTSLKEEGHCTEAAVEILALRLVSVAKSPKIKREYTG